MTKKPAEEYFCSKHGNEGTIECQECVTNLKRLLADYNGHIVTDVEELKQNV